MPEMGSIGTFNSKPTSASSFHLRVASKAKIESGREAKARKVQYDQENDQK
jgi:hypothetical protein